MVNFPGNERDSRKLKKVLELVQHFREQCTYYSSIYQKISNDGNLINYEEEKKEREKRKNCSLYISETNVYKPLMVLINVMWLYVACRA